MTETIDGKVLRIFSADTNTDEIIAGKFKYDGLNFKKLAVHAFESIDPEFYEDSKKLKEPIVVAARNFGCGSSREQAPWVIKACGVPLVVAESFARIFYRNCFNIGLPLVECEGISSKVDQGDSLEVNFERGILFNRTKGTEHEFMPLPKFMQEILSAGGLVSYLKERGGYNE